MLLGSLFFQFFKVYDCYVLFALFYWVLVNIDHIIFGFIFIYYVADINQLSCVYMSEYVCVCVCVCVFVWKMAMEAPNSTKLKLVSLEILGGSPESSMSSSSSMQSPSSSTSSSSLPPLSPSFLLKLSPSSL